MVRKLFCLLAVLAIAGIANADLVAFYSFDQPPPDGWIQNEGSAGTAADGVLMNGATIIDLGNCNAFEGALLLDYGDGTVHQYMDIGRDWANWNGPWVGHLEPMTIMAWIQVTPGTEGSWRTIMSKGFESSWCLAMGTQYGVGDDKIAFSAHRGVAAWSPITGTVNVRDGQWHHIAGVVESISSAKLYIDGVFQGSSTCWMGVNYNEENAWIGYDPLKTDFDYSWNGMIDEVRVYDEVLSGPVIMSIIVEEDWFREDGLWITGPGEVAESSQAQYTAATEVSVWRHGIWRHGIGPWTSSKDVTEEAIWWVEPDTYASIDANGLLTTENIDTSQSITIHAQYYTLCEETVEAEMAVDLCCSADLNDDGKIDLVDYAILARQWLEAPGVPSADISPLCSGDGIVDMDDLAIFANEWLEEISKDTPAVNECDNWQVLHPEWIFCDDFESDTPLVRMGRYFEYDDDGGDFIRIDSAGLADSNGMRVLFQAGEVSAGSLKLGFGRNPNAYMNKGIRETEDFRDIYYRMYLKMQDGWQGTPLKLSRALVFVRHDLCAAATAFNWQSHQNNPCLAIEALRCVDMNDEPICGYHDDCQWLGRGDGITPIFDSEHDDTWFCVEHHIKLNDPGMSNGVQEFWIDGQLEARLDGLDFVRSYTDYAINAVFFENYWNSGSPQIQERYFDNIVVSTEPIGCGD